MSKIWKASGLGFHWLNEEVRYPSFLYHWSFICPYLEKYLNSAPNIQSQLKSFQTCIDQWGAGIRGMIDRSAGNQSEQSRIFSTAQNIFQPNLNDIFPWLHPLYCWLVDVLKVVWWIRIRTINICIRVRIMDDSEQSDQSQGATSEVILNKLYGADRPVCVVEKYSDRPVCLVL